MDKLYNFWGFYGENNVKSLPGAYQNGISINIV